MKRTREQRDARDVVCDANWASLNGDLIHALVVAQPCILPPLYLLSKHYHAALDAVHPNAPLWEAHFNRKPGYTDYAPNKDTDLTWKMLVAMQKQGLCDPTYYLLTKRAQFECKAFAPSDFVGSLECLECHALMTEHVIKKWVPKKRTILRFHPERVVNGTKLRPLSFTEILPAIGNTGLPSSRGSIYCWAVSKNAIFVQCQTNTETLLVPAALPANEVALLGERAWTVEQFDAVV